MRDITSKCVLAGHVAVGLLLLSLNAYADRYGMYEDEECVVYGDCGSLEDAFMGLLMIGGASIGVVLLRGASDKLALILMEAFCTYISFGIIGDKYGIGYNIIAFIGTQFWIMVLWALSDAISKKDN